MNRHPLAPLIALARLEAEEANETAVVVRILPADAEAERALLAEADELVRQGIAEWVEGW